VEPLKRCVCDIDKPTNLPVLSRARERPFSFRSDAASERELFDSDATCGALRDIDRLATSALREPARLKKQLERDTLARILDAEIDAAVE
jgi:hypothetical protein